MPKSDVYLYKFFAFFSAEIEQKYKEIMKMSGILTFNGEVSF